MNEDLNGFKPGIYKVPENIEPPEQLPPCVVFDACKHCKYNKNICPWKNSMEEEDEYVDAKRRKNE